MFVAMMGSTLAYGLQAEKAQVTVEKVSSIKVNRVTPPNGSIFITSAAKRSSSASTRTKAREAKRGAGLSWNYVSIPLKVEGKCKGDGEPDFIPELAVDVTLLFSIATQEKPVMLKKTVTYVDIPVGEFNVGVFLSPADVSLLTVAKTKPDEGGDGDLSKSLIGFAIEARFDGNNCVKSSDKEPNNFVFASDIERKLSPKWWTSNLSANGAKLLSIEETPFAAYYYPHFPQTKNLFASTSGSRSASSAVSSTPSPSVSTSTSTSSSSSTSSDSDEE